LRYFILAIEEFSETSMQEIDRGHLRHEVVQVINCVRSSLFTSFGVRKDVNVILCPINTTGRQIRIGGETLRYMGPDERSILTLLLKTGRISTPEKRGQVEISSPGITVERNDLPSLAAELHDSSIFVESPEGSDLGKMGFAERVAYICPLGMKTDLREVIAQFQGRTTMLCNTAGINQPEKMILLINTAIDRTLSRHEMAS
jgi:tRNA pseudouridine-54 N-methylase